MSGLRRESTLEDKFRAEQQRPLLFRLRQYRRLAEKGVSTVPELLAKYDSLHRRTKRVALEIGGFTGDRRLVPLLKRVFRDDAGLRVVAAMSLGYLGGKRATAFSLSVLSCELASRNPDPAFYEPAFWALSTMYPEDEEVQFRFLDLFDCDDVSPSVRSDVLDRLGCAVPSDSEVDRRSAIFQRTRRVVLAALQDPEADVRFFALYAVGQLGLTEALPVLRCMAQQDQGACPSLWTVAEEAEDVISYLTTGWWPDREPRTGRVLNEPPDEDAVQRDSPQP